MYRNVIVGAWLGFGAASCGPWGAWRGEPDPYDLDFQIPRSEDFASLLSDYDLYQLPLATLQPADGVVPYELSSELFTDYAQKQRLMRIPEGATIAAPDGVTAVFPEGTVLAKTFFYPLDLRDPNSALRVVETRLLVKTAGLWNVATYLWNEEQTEAHLGLSGATTEVAWVDGAGQDVVIDYAVPHEGECVTCHQRGGTVTYVGPSLQNLNRDVSGGGQEVNQLARLQAGGVLEGGSWADVPKVVDYGNAALPLERRARAYLDINCAHCHNPDAWGESAERDVDFRHTTPLGESGMRHKSDEMEDMLVEGDMPFLGTTVPHEEGIELVLDYLDSL